MNNFNKNLSIGRQELILECQKSITVYRIINTTESGPKKYMTPSLHPLAAKFPLSLLSYNSAYLAIGILMYVSIIE